MVASSPVLMAVHAHPDDECIGTGGSLARYHTEGVRTVLVTCTDGAVGEISDPALATPANLVDVRSRELDESVRILGIDRLVKLGYRDSGMAGTDDNQNPLSFLQANFDDAVGRVVQVMRQEKPQVVVTYDENGGYGHPDHIRAHQVAVAAFEASGDPTRYPTAGPPWTPSKLYYAVLSRTRMLEFGERLRAAGIEVPFGRDDDDGAENKDRPRFGVDDDRVTTTVDVTRYIDAKRSSLVAHATQMGPEQFFMRLPPELFAEAFSRETFQRMRGPAEATSPEDDLFAGL